MKSVIITLLSPEEIDQFIVDFPHYTSQEIADRFNIKITTVRNYAFKLRLKKSKEFIAKQGQILANSKSGIATRFKPGNVPANKGKKMSEEQYTSCQKTMFKPGNKPHNSKPVGSERITKDGYIEVRMDCPGYRKWKLKHRIVWESVNGKIPNGFNVQFKDGNRKNCDINNLYLISRSEQLQTQNSMYCRYPKEVQLAIKAKGALNRQIRQKSKQDN